MPPVELSIGELMRVMKKLKDGVKIRKCKVDGQKMELTEGTLKGDLDDLDVHIACAYRDGDNTVKVKGTHPRSDEGNVITIDGTDMAAADIDLRLVVRGLSLELKATLEYKRDAADHTIELYAKITGV